MLARAAARGESAALVCASAGNFGLALAFACASYQRSLTVFVPVGASSAKVDGIRRCGARVVSIGDDFDAAKDAARHFAHAHSLGFVEDGAESSISEGAGTIALELLADSKAFDAIPGLPAGQWGLLAVRRWIKAHAPATGVISKW